MKGKSGFTLMETMAVVAVSVFILIVIYGVWAVAQGSLQTSSGILDLQRQAAMGINRMFNELYEAGRATIDIGPDNDILTFQLPTPIIDPNYSTLTTIYDDNGNIIWGDGTFGGQERKIRYLLPAVGEPNAGRLIKRVLEADESVHSNTIWANYINTIEFTEHTTAEGVLTAIIITIFAQKNTSTGRLLQTELQSQVKFRN